MEPLGREQVAAMLASIQNGAALHTVAGLDEMATESDHITHDESELLQAQSLAARGIHRRGPRSPLSLADQRRSAMVGSLARSPPATSARLPTGASGTSSEPVRVHTTGPSDDRK